MTNIVRYLRYVLSIWSPSLPWYAVSLSEVQSKYDFETIQQGSYSFSIITQVWVLELSPILLIC